MVSKVIDIVKDSHIFIARKARVVAMMVPAEVLGRIFQECDIETKLAVMQACRFWRYAGGGNRNFWIVDVKSILDAASLPSDVKKDTKAQVKSSSIYWDAKTAKKKAASPLMKAMLTHTANIANANVTVTGDFMYNTPMAYRSVSRIAAQWQPLIKICKLYFADRFGGNIPAAFLPATENKGLALGFAQWPYNSDEELSNPSGTAKSKLGCLWTHTREESAQALTVTDLARTKETEADEFEKVRKEKDWSRESKEFKDFQKSFFIFRTFFCVETKRLRSQVFSTHWGTIRHLNLTLAGSSYHYLPILQHTPRLAWLFLTFTSPPILPNDAPTSTLLPAAYPGDRAIKLELLKSLSLTFINNSFFYPSSQRFIDAIKCSNPAKSKFKEMAFKSDHAQMWQPSTPTINDQAYIPLQNFIATYGFRIKDLDVNIGPGANVPLLLPNRGVHCLSFDFNCHHPMQADITLPGKGFSSLLKSIFRKIYSGFDELILKHPVTCASLNSELKELEELIRIASGKRLRFDAVEVELTVVDAEELTVSPPGRHNVPSLDKAEFNVASYVKFTQKLDTQSGEYLCDGRFQRKILKVEFGRDGYENDDDNDNDDDGSRPGYWKVEAFTDKRTTCLGGMTCTTCASREVNIASAYEYQS